MNIKFKLTLWFTLIVATILGFSFYVVYENYSLFRQTNFFDRLTDRARYVTDAVIDAKTIDDEILDALGAFNLNLSPSLRLTICDSVGNPLESVGKPLKIPEGALAKLQNNIKYDEQILDTQYVYFTYTRGGHNNIILAAAYDKSGINKVLFLRQVFFIIWILSVITTAFAGWWFARLSLRPIKHVISEVSNITERNLHSRILIKGSTNDEIAQLSTTFNQMLDRLESAFVLQKDFVSNASHEFRTPLTAIKGQIQVALLKQRNTNEYEQLLQSLNDDINNLIGLLNALQDLAKANANVLPKSFSPINILDIILDVQNELSKTKPHYSVNIKVNEYTVQSDSLFCLGESSLLKSVVTNIIDNGCKFSPDFNTILSIMLNHDYIVLDFTDEGVGISPENLCHVFEPFFRGNDTRNIYGHGIGMSLVKKIIELHKGDIQIQSALGKGTTVTVRLPIYNL